MADEAQGDLLTQEVSQQETTSPWYSEENKEVVERCGWKEPNDVIKGYRGLEKDYSGRVKMPSPESSAEEIRAFYQKTGCPENPEGYEIAGVDDLSAELGVELRNEGVEAAMKQIAYDQGVSKQAFESIVKGYYDRLATDLRTGKEAGEKALKNELGKEYDESITIANRFFDTCSEEFCSLIKTTGLANNPIVVKEFIDKGKQTLSDTLVRGSASGGEEEYVPRYKDSPEMYATDESEDGAKARTYFEARGHKF